MGGLVQWVKKRRTCQHADIRAIRGNFLGAVAGSLQCLPKSIISLAFYSLKMSYIRSNELWEDTLFPNFHTAAPTLIQNAQTVELQSLHSLTLAGIKIGIMRRYPQVKMYINRTEVQEGK